MESEQNNAHPPDVAHAPIENAAASQAQEMLARARVGTIALAIRGGVLQVIFLVGNIYLYRHLTPADYGIYAIVRWMLGVFGLIGDVGLGGALIQQKQEPSREQLSAVHYTQLALATTFAVALCIFVEPVRAFWPTLPASSRFVFYALALELVLTSLRTVPTIGLERKLAYPSLAILEVLTTLGFTVTAVIAAWMGAGPLAFGYAAVVQGTLGLVAAYMLNPFRPTLGFTRETLRPLMAFGATYQLKNVSGFAISAANPILVGRFLGQAALGHITWAMENGYFPLQLVSIVSRISFPLLSRLREDRAVFAEAVERSVQVCAIVTLACCSVFLGLGHNLAQTVFGAQWLTAVPLLHAYSVAISVGFLTPLLMPALDADGGTKETFAVSAFSAVLVWTMTPLGMWSLGVWGFAWTYALVVILANIPMIYLVKQRFPQVRFWRAFLAPAIACGVTTLIALRWFSGWANGWVHFPIGCALVIVTFAVVLATLDRHGILLLYRYVRGTNSAAT